MAETERNATTTQDHDEIREWVEKRNGYPAMVAATERNDRPGGMLRIDFGDPDGSRDTGLPPHQLGGILQGVRQERPRLPARGQ